MGGIAASRPALAALAAGLLLGGPALAERGFLTNQSANSVWEVDLASGEKLREWAIPGAPAGVAVAPSGLVYVTSPETGTVTAIDPESGALTPIAVGGGPLGIAANPVTGEVYVADWYADRLTVIRDGAPAGIVGVGHSPSGVAVTPDGATILTADRDSDEVSVIDAKSFTRLATISVGARPFGVTIDATGARAYAANVGSNSVSVIDIAARKVVGSVPTDERPYKVALAQGRGFVTNSYGSDLTVFDLESLAPIGTIEVGDYPEGIEATKDGRTLYVANWFSNTMSRVDAAAMEVTGEIETGDGPRSFGDFIHD